jgi:hypothetical protein
MPPRLGIALVLLALTGCGGEDDQGIAQTPARTNTQTTQTATAEEGSQVRVVLTEQNGSGVSGTASLSREDTRTEIEVEVDGSSATQASIHAGTCDELDPTPIEVLSGMGQGRVSTRIDTSVQALTAESHSVVVGDASQPEACGEIRSSQS